MYICGKTLESQLGLQKNSSQMLRAFGKSYFFQTTLLTACP